MQLDRTMTVAEIVSRHPTTAPVFKKNRIDFCCKGNVTVEDACSAGGLDARALFEALEGAIAVEPRSNIAADANGLDVEELIRHIVETHHTFLRRVLPFVEELASKVARVHGDHNPKLKPLAALVNDFSEKLEAHLDDEERHLFPALIVGRVTSDEIKRRLGQMHEEHLEVGSQLEQLRALADDYSVPEWGCGSYRVLFKELEAIEDDIHRHVHLENHVLMPRFIR